MAKVKFSVMCTGSYITELEIPKEIVKDKGKVLNYIHNHLCECPASEIDWLSDFEPSEAVTEADIFSITE